MSHTHTPQSLHRARNAAEPALIELRDFCYAYDDVIALSHVDLDIYAGDSVVLMGDNGSGKSTLLKAFVGLLFPQQGSYRFDGKVVDERSMRDPSFSKRLHQRIGFIFQDSDSQLFCPTVEDEVAFGPLQMGLPEAEVQQRVADTCALLGIEQLRSRAPYNLSGGEKKRVAIACVLSMNPDVLCLDEPLAGLDAKARAWLLSFLRQLKEVGKTLIIATHDQSLADELADFFVYVGEFHGYEDRPHVHINS